MARGAADKPYTNFSAGLVTEATGLSYPENSVQDILNMVPMADGSVRKRFGLEAEDAAEVIGADVLTADTEVNTYIWKAPAGVDGLELLVMQIGNKIHFRIWGNENGAESSAADVAAVTGGAGSFDVSGSFYAWDSATDAEIASSPMSFTSGLGLLFVTGPHLRPFYIEFRPDTPILAAWPLGAGLGSTAYMRFRDFDGVVDGSPIDAHSAILTADGLYNLMNQGWKEEHINAYFTGQGVWPADNQQWILGKDSSDDFDDALLAKQDFGTSPAPKGRATLDLLEGDKDGYFTISPAVNGISGPLSAGVASRAAHGGSFRTNTFFAGRHWLAGDENQYRPNGIYFSKIVNHPRDAGTFHSINDPTSEHFPDLLDNDGGVIFIEEASSINRLIPFQEGLIVIAQNGVWFIRGGEAGFTANTYGIDKISDDGCVAPRSVISAEGNIYYWGDSGIHAITIGTKGLPISAVVSNNIRGLYSALPAQVRRTAVGEFDPITRKLIWLHHNPEDAEGVWETSFRTRMLIGDLALEGAWTRFDLTLGEAGTTGPVALYRPKNQVIGRLGVIGQTPYPDEPSQTSIKVLVASSTTGGVAIAEFNDLDFEDGEQLFSGAADAYEAYVETGAEHLGDLQRFKQATFVHSFFSVTGHTWTVAGEVDIPSSCLVQFRWDWHNTGAGNRWSVPQQAYRTRRPLVPDPFQPIDNGEGIAYTKLKARGKGRALAIRYESELRKDTRLLGFSVSFTSNGA